MWVTLLLLLATASAGLTQSNSKGQWPSLQSVASQLGVTAFVRAMDATDCSANDDTFTSKNCTDFVLQAAGQEINDTNPADGKSFTRALIIMAPSDDATAAYMQQENVPGLTQTAIRQHIVDECPQPENMASVWGCKTRVRQIVKKPGWQADDLKPTEITAQQMVISPQDDKGYLFFGLPTRIAKASRYDCLRFQTSGVLCKVDKVTVPAYQGGVYTPLDYLANNRTDVSVTLDIIKTAITPNSSNAGSLKSLLDNKYGTFFVPTDDAWRQFFQDHSTTQQDFIKTPAAYWTLYYHYWRTVLLPTAKVLNGKWAGLNARYAAYNPTDNSGFTPTLAPFRPYLKGQGIPDKLVARLVDFDIPAGAFYVHVVDRVIPACDFQNCSQ